MQIDNELLQDDDHEDHFIVGDSIEETPIARTNINSYYPI